MTINKIALPWVRKFLPASRVLSFGFPEGLSPQDLDRIEELVVLDLPQQNLPHLPQVEKIANVRFVDWDLNHENNNVPWFDLVLDPGTCEHVANVGAAVKTLLSSVAVGGHIVHVAPITMFNHGYWAFQPCFLYDIYHQNGFYIKHFMPYTLAMKPIITNFPLDSRQHYFPSEAWLLVVATRVSEQFFKWPIQQEWR